MDCPCNNCNGIIRDPITNPVPLEEEVKEVLSLYDRLSKLAYELEKNGVSAIYINEVNEIAEEVDSIDNDIVEVQGDRYTGDDARVKLGEISKKLY